MLKNIVHINEDDFTELVSQGEITIGGITYEYDDSGSTEYIVEPIGVPAYANTAGYAYTANSDSEGNNIYSNYIRNSTIRITYEELVTKINSNQLIPGQKYRITDYQTMLPTYDFIKYGNLMSQISLELACCTKVSDDYANYDVIVTAVNNNTLFEDAKICKHSANDEIFDDHRICDWNIKYTIENNPAEYLWALNEWEVDVEIDDNGDVVSFSGILTYYRFVESVSQYYGVIVSEENNMIYLYPVYISGLDPTEATFTLVSNDSADVTVDVTEHNTGKGVIYYMEDENHNKAGYDFMNIMFKRFKPNSTSTKYVKDEIIEGLIELPFCVYDFLNAGNYGFTQNEYDWYYTFSKITIDEDENTNETIYEISNGFYRCANMDLSDNICMCYYVFGYGVSKHTIHDNVFVFSEFDEWQKQYYFTGITLEKSEYNTFFFVDDSVENSFLIEGIHIGALVFNGTSVCKFNVLSMLIESSMFCATSMECICQNSNIIGDTLLSCVFSNANNIKLASASDIDLYHSDNVSFGSSCNHITNCTNITDETLYPDFMQLNDITIGNNCSNIKFISHRTISDNTLPDALGCSTIFDGISYLDFYISGISSYSYNFVLNNIHIKRKPVDGVFGINTINIPYSFIPQNCITGNTISNFTIDTNSQNTVVIYNEADFVNPCYSLSPLQYVEQNGNLTISRNQTDINANIDIQIYIWLDSNVGNISQMYYTDTNTVTESLSGLTGHTVYAIGYATNMQNREYYRQTPTLTLTY